MEPVTHVLTGAVLARAGVNRRAAYATAAMMIAAELPDLDTVSSWWGPVTGFEHHRGITHTFIALPVEAALVVAGFWALHALRKRPGGAGAPAAWGWLYGGTLLALLSHLLLDWTNNYGLRPFAPFNPRWYAGSFVFIFEPVLFLILVAALVGPALFGLINAEVGAQRARFRGQPSAVAALLAIGCLYGFRWNEHELALQRARTLAPAEMTRVFASPYPGNPFLWHLVTDTPDAYQLSELNLRVLDGRGTEEATVYKPQATLPVLAAKRSFLGRIYLDWSSYPVITEAADNADPNHPLAAVTFGDARFYYNVSLFHGRPEPGREAPLTGTVLLDMSAPEGQRVVETRMGGRLQK